MTAKLYSGGGEVVVHSSVGAVPRVRPGRRAAAVADDEVAEQEQDPGERDEAADRLEQVVGGPAEAAGIRVDAARHAEQADDVHREEEEVRPDEDDPEADLPGPLEVERPVTFGNQ